MSSTPAASISGVSVDKKSVTTHVTEVFDVESQTPAQKPTYRKSASITESMTKDPIYWRIATTIGMTGGIVCIALGESKVIVGGDIGPTNVASVMGVVILVLSLILFIASLTVTSHNKGYGLRFWRAFSQPSNSEVNDEKTAVSYSQRVDRLNKEAWVEERSA